MRLLTVIDRIEFGVRSSTLFSQAKMTILIPVLPLFAFTSAVIAQSTSTISCSTTLTASYPSPSVVEGWEARLVANNLQKPRGILFDSRGQLLVVESGKGISALTLNDHGGTCVSVADTKDVIQDSSVCVRRNVRQVDCINVHLPPPTSFLTELSSQQMDRLYMHHPPSLSPPGPTVRTQGT